MIKQKQPNRENNSKNSIMKTREKQFVTGF